MGGSSSSKKQQASRITEHDKAILQLKQMRDKLKQYKVKIEQQLANERTIAKQLVSEGKIDKAKLLLKKKKFFESKLEHTDGQLENLDQMVHNLEYKQIEVQVVNGMKQGTECLRQLNEMMKLDDVEKLMDDTHEAIDYQNRVSQLISGSTEQDDIDMDDLESELNEIMGIALPEVPDHDLPTPTKQKEINDKVKIKQKKIAVEAD